jgi:hypothetical protein
MNHIDEGLKILDAIEASDTAKRAFCLHPLAQGDAEIGQFDPHLASSPEVLVATIEYRNVANRYLSHHHGVAGLRPIPSPLAVVNDMLIADKVQNRKDFLTNPAITGEKWDRLNSYFLAWLEALGVSDNEYVWLCEIASDHP